jgi:hypothetical protein
LTLALRWPVWGRRSALKGSAAAEISNWMAEYFFDFRSGDTFSKENDGIELPDTEAAHEIALGPLVDAARDAVTEGSSDQRFAVEVRNGMGRVLEVGAIFYCKIFSKQ